MVCVHVGQVIVFGSMHIPQDFIFQLSNVPNMRCFGIDLVALLLVQCQV
jgi:hypothetical protein